MRPDFVTVIDLIMRVPCCADCIVRAANIPVARVEEILVELRQHYIIRADGDCSKCPRRGDDVDIYWLRPPDWLGPV